MSEKSLRNGANHGFLVPAKAVWRTTGSLALERMQKRLRAEANGVYWFAAERQNGNYGQSFFELWPKHDMASLDLGRIATCAAGVLIVLLAVYLLGRNKVRQMLPGETTEAWGDRDRRRGLWLAVFLLGGPFLTWAGYCCVQFFQVFPFNVQIERYLRQPAIGSVEASLYLSGRILPIDVDRGRVASVYFDLPLGLRAERPEQVGTVVWLRRGKGSYVGWYRSHEAPSAFESECEITVIDAPGWFIIGHDSLKRDPSEWIRAEEAKATKEVTAEPVSDKAIAEYLESLPRR